MPELRRVLALQSGPYRFGTDCHFPAALQLATGSHQLCTIGTVRITETDTQAIETYRGRTALMGFIGTLKYKAQYLAL